MAKHLIVRYIDDLDGSDLGETANTIHFAFDGANYSIDLSDRNADTFRQAIARYVEAGRRIDKGGVSDGSRPSARTGVTKAAREWARSNGYTVSDRGRIPSEVLEAIAVNT